MTLGINSNISSSQALRNTQKSLNRVSKSFERLSSGKQINRASDNPAALAIAEALLADAETNSVAARNISDGVSLANIAEGSLDQASQITTRLSELATQSANGTLSDDQRVALNQEYQSLRGELDRISQTTEFNGQQLLSGSANFDIQAGTDGSAASRVSIALPGVSSASLGLATDISTQENAQAALEETKTAGSNISSARGQIGASVSRLNTAFNNVQVARENQIASASAITDVDVAKETAQLTRNRILSQAGTAVQAQANQLPGLALQLLK